MRISEPSLYPFLMEIIREAGGEAVSQIQFNSEPDIIFDLGGRKWLLSVKIGETNSVYRKAFLQYKRHQEESGINQGLLIFFPESIRQTCQSEKALRDAVRTCPITVLIDAGPYKEEITGQNFVQVMSYCAQTICQRLAVGMPSHYSVSFVINILREQLLEMMNNVTLGEEQLVSIVTNAKLFGSLGELKTTEVREATRFLAAYIYLSQVLFSRLLVAARQDLHEFALKPKEVSRHWVRRLFNRIQNIDYQPIYSLDVLDAIPDDYMKTTVDLMWHLEIEKVPYELPGRLFHELLPEKVRKLLAAFYTRPIAADILAGLSIQKSTATVLDPAGGSGTILTAAYRRKRQLWEEEGRLGNPHQRFCEEEIFGVDIMPFAVQLMAANLCACDPTVPVERTQVIQMDSLRLEPSEYPAGVTMPSLFPSIQKGVSPRTGEQVSVQLKPVDVILMNPPFTKLERGIRRFVSLERFSQTVGGAVNLWGHFIALADVFLKPGGMLGAVLPINILRGRESEKVRKILFAKWTPKYVIKAAKNYGFSEYAEYRDIIVIAQKKESAPNDFVKFAIIKQNLLDLEPCDVQHIISSITNHKKLRNDPLLDIDSYNISEVHQHLSNLMWFCGTSDLTIRDELVSFVSKVSKKLGRLQIQVNKAKYVRTGKRFEGSQAKYLCITRLCGEERVERAFLRFSKEDQAIVEAVTPRGHAMFHIEKSALWPSLRTPVGIPTMELGNSFDWIAVRPYQALQDVCRAAGTSLPPKQVFSRLKAEISRIATNLVLARRINPFSPAQHFFAFYSEQKIVPSDLFNCIMEIDKTKAKAITVILNSIVFLTQFILLKEESTGRNIDIRLSDLTEMYVMPSLDAIPRLCEVFDRYSSVRFPPLREQLDINFDARYEEYSSMLSKKKEKRLFSILDKPVEPFIARLNMDKEVCEALGINVSEEEIKTLYQAIVAEMLTIKALSRE